MSHLPQVISIPEKDDESQTVSTSLTEEDFSQAESNDTSEGFNYTIAQNQVTIVHDNPERTIIDQIDTEPHLTIRQIRAYLSRQLNANKVKLFYQNTPLDRDDFTLADYGWSTGECETITVRTDTQPNILYVI